LLITTSKGAYEINTLNFAVQSAIPREYSNHDVLLYKKLNGNEYFLCNRMGLLAQNEKGDWHIFHCPDKAPNLMGLNSIHGQLVITGFKNCYIFNNKALLPCQVLFHGQDITKDGINDIVEDRTGQIYINSLRYGLLKANLQSNTFVCESIVESSWFEHGNVLYSNFYDAINHQFFIGTQQGLYLYTPKQPYFQESDEKDSVGTVRTLQYSNHKILVGTEGGLFSYNSGRNLEKLSASFLASKRNFFTQILPLSTNECLAVGNQFAVISENQVRPFHSSVSNILKQENMLVASLLNNRIYIFSNSPSLITILDLATKQLKQIPHHINELITPPVLNIGSKIIFHTHSQLFELNTLTPQLKEIEPGSSAGITDVQFYENKIIASSMIDGILIMDTNYHLLRKISVESIANENEVRSIYIHQNILWFATPNGIGSFDIKSEKFRFYRSGQNFRTLNFYAGSHTILDDTLYFGGDNGIVAVNTKQLQSTPLHDDVYLMNVSLYKNGQLWKVNNPENHSFSFNENNLEIQLIHNNTTFPSCFQYEYRLNNTSTSIPIESNGLIKLYNLAPNAYHLAIIDKQTKEEKAKYQFTITPPWYQTWWFRTILALGIAGNIIWITRLYFKRRLVAQQKELEKQAALQAERDRISNDMHDDLGSGLSSIKLISEMLKRKHKDEETQQDLNDIVDNATELTSTMREMVWSLNPRNDSLQQFLHHMQQYSKQFFEPSEIKCVIEMPSVSSDISMNGFLRRNVLLTIKEIQNNIIKHAHATEVNIRATYGDGNLYFCIADNGQGLPENTVFNNGFYTMQKRIRECGGEFVWKNITPGLQIDFHVKV
ncbi:MAG TPA: histidine kinase, partial [Chitinophagaceae bacterium]|nr:histidine kinase [Chitinophagaceae bacterium]